MSEPLPEGAVFRVTWFADGTTQLVFDLPEAMPMGVFADVLEDIAKGIREGRPERVG